MPNCECLEGCPFFNDKMESMPVMANKLKERYCKGTSKECARYMVFSALGRDKVPATLCPNQIDIAKQVLASA